jgi:Protein of unknown function (DUF3303)
METSGARDAVHGDRAVQGSRRQGGLPPPARAGPRGADGLRYEGSWVEASFERCFQLMECDDARLLQQWVAFWGDLVEFEIVPVMAATETRQAIEPLL